MATVGDLAGRLNLGVVAVVGAGLSLGARYPNTSGLNALLWDAVDSDPQARAAVAARLSVTDAPAKALIAEDADRWGVAWAMVAESAVARRRLQSGFAALDQARAGHPSPSHEALARLIHVGTVEAVVSFNWDSALESAYARLYGTAIPEGVLFKPHGDVARPDLPWTLPHQDGRISFDVLRRVTALVEEHPRTLLIVGYSESDRDVIEQLIAPLDERWWVSRVGPSADGPDDVAGTADEVLGALAEAAARDEDAAAWHVVTFDNQRGIEAALEGRRLLPRDVAACPPLPEVHLVAESLRRNHAVVLNGESGSGKSITAYQVARQLSLDGFEVLRLRDVRRHAGPRTWLADLRAFPQRKVLFVDDAQDLSADVVRELAETATPDQLVLIAGVDHVAGGVATHSVSGATAVATLEQYVRQHRDEMLPKVRELDDWVGDGVGDERFEDRLRSAARERTAWQFFYALTGGWRRTSRAVQEVRDQNHADLLACALAVAQVAGVDSGVTVDELMPYAQAVGRDRAWIERSLEALRSQLLAVEEDGVWRCPHLRAAYSIVRWMLHPPYWDVPPVTRVEVPPIASATVHIGPRTQSTEPASGRRRQSRPVVTQEVQEEDRLAVTGLLRVALEQASTSMQGVAWLLGRDLQTGAQWVLRKYGVRSPERDRGLTLRALSTPPGTDVAMAAFLIEQLHGPDSPVVIATVWEHIDVVVEWVHAVTPAAGWALGSLVNVLINADRDRVAHALAGVEPGAVASLVEAGGWPHIYSSVQAVDRIAFGGGLGFARAVGAALDEDVLDRMLDGLPSLHAADQLLKLLAHLNPDMGIRLFEAHSDRLAKEFATAPVERYSDLFETFGILLGYWPMFLRRRKPAPAARRAARTFLRAMDTRGLVSALACPRDDSRWHNFWEFLSMFMDVDPRGWARVATAVDLDALATTLAAQMPHPSRNLLYVLYALSGARVEDVRTILDRHRDEFERLDPFLVYLDPELSITLLNRGLPLDLDLESQHYQGAASLVGLIATVDADVARQVAEANATAFSAGLGRNVSPPFDDLSRWVEVCDVAAPGLVDRVLTGLPAGVVAAWADALRRPTSRRQIGPLVVRAAQTGDTPAAVEARALMKRFTGLRH